jgi:hypothetical protein
MKQIALIFAALPLFAISCAARQSNSETMQNMPGAQATPTAKMPAMPDMPGMQPQNFIDEILAHDTSGTSAQPNSTPVPMLMTKKGSWTLMFHASVFVVDQQQSGPRGADKFFSTNWLMGMAQRKAGPGIFTIRTMLSLEPATITGRQYPLLFQQGETAYGKPIADGQHPHDFIMELGAFYDVRLERHTLLSFYFAPVGDPAIGPEAYPHRPSAAEDPLATLGHHQEDSTHVADDVATAGLTYRIARIEASGFHGREPDEFRWDIDQGRIDSWSLRLTVQPGRNWSGQYSYSRIHSPEALYPRENQERMTASIMYNRPLRIRNEGSGNWSSIVVWGRTSAIGEDSVFNSYLLESTLHFSERNNVWTRIENARRSNELILGENALPANFQEMPIGSVQAYTFGYDREISVAPRLASAIGAQFTTYGVPDRLQPIYEGALGGSRPFGVAMFLRLRPFSGETR